MKKIKEMNAGGVAGFQVPIGIKKRKKKVDELLELNDTITMAEVIGYFSELREEELKAVEEMLDSGDYVKLTETISTGFIENSVRSSIRDRVKEVVRKQPDGQYTLYSPNPGKEQGSKKSGTFPTKLAARRAELSRFPPKDPAKLSRLRQDVDKLRKHPELASQEPSKSFLGKRSKKAKKPKKESLERLISKLAESLFREEKEDSGWDEYVSKLSKQAVLGDKTFQAHQKAITKKSEQALKSAMKSVKTAMSSVKFDVKDSGVKKDAKKEQIYLEFSISDKEGTGSAGPLYIFIEKGVPKLEVSDSARNDLTKMSPEVSKQLRVELMSIQEDSLDKITSVHVAIKKRDEYLTKIENKVDNVVSNMSSLEITMLKKVLTSKFRKIK